MDPNPASAPSDQPVPGTAQCHRCARHDGMRCAYVDGSGRVCETDWCPAHRSMIDGRPYCRRHAGIVSTLGRAATQGHLPNIDNRAHSLANWVAKDLDEPIRHILDHARRPGSEERLVAGPISYVFTAYRTHLWERAWELVDGGDVVLKVSVDVDEDTDSEVRLRIGRRTIMSSVPPWIERRYAGPRFTSDEQARREFYAMLLSAVQEAVDRERP